MEKQLKEQDMMKKVIKFFYQIKMEKEKNIMKMERLNLKENISMEKGGMEKDMIIMEKKYLKLNMEKERLKNLIIKEIYYLMVNISMGKGKKVLNIIIMEK